MILGAFNKLSLKITGRRYDYRHSGLYARAFARIFRDKLRKIRHDCVVVCGGTEYGAYLQATKPVFYVLDRTIAGAINYHLILQDLWPFSCTQSIATDKRAMTNATHIFFSSRWAADHARVHYGIPSSKISVIPFGANLDAVPPAMQLDPPKTPGPFKLLFIGSSWEHKGGDIAHNALTMLLGAGKNVELTVVGCTPPEEKNHEKMKVIPFVDKNTTQGMAQFYMLLENHHVLILPTRFDCTPIVFCEASAFALPVLSAETGGVAAHVNEGVNGYLLPYHDKGEGYAARIERWMEQPEEYESLRRSARTLYETTLNWNSWAIAFSKKIAHFFSRTER